MRTAAVNDVVEFSKFLKPTEFSDFTGAIPVSRRARTASFSMPGRG